MQKLIGIVLLYCFPTLLYSHSFAQQYIKIDSLTFRVEASECPSATGTNSSRVSSGVKVTSERYPGVITALHGVCGCKKIKVFNIFGESAPVELKFANIENDVAVLNSELFTTRFKGGYELPSSVENMSLDTVNAAINGYGLGAWLSTERRVTTFRPAMVLLEEILKPALADELRRRGSPNPEITVLRYTGGSGPGTSGAPVVFNDQLIAIQNGGLGQLGENTCWGIPLAGFEEWKFIKGSELSKDTRYPQIKVPHITELYASGLENKTETCLPFSDSDLMKIYVLPFSNSGIAQNKAIGLERNISGYIEQKFRDSSIMVLFEGQQEKLKIPNGTAAHNAIALNADLVLYGVYNMRDLDQDKSEITIKYAWKDRKVLKGFDRPEIEGEVIIRFQGYQKDSLHERVKMGLTNLIYYLRGVQYFSNNQFQEAQKMFAKIEGTVGFPEEKSLMECFIYKELKDDTNYHKALLALCEKESCNWRVSYALNEFYKVHNVYGLNREKLLKSMVECFPKEQKTIYRELLELDGLEKNKWIRLKNSNVNWEIALEHIEALIELKQEDFSILQSKANLLWESGKRSEALRSMQQAHLMRTYNEPWGKVNTVRFDYLEIMVKDVMDQLYTDKQKKRMNDPGVSAKRSDRRTSSEKATDQMEFLRKRIVKSENDALIDILKDDKAFSTLITEIAILNQADTEMALQLLDSAIEIDQSNFFPRLIRARMYEKIDSAGERSYSELQKCIDQADNNEGLMALTRKCMEAHGFDIRDRRYYESLGVRFNKPLASN